MAVRRPERCRILSWRATSWRQSGPNKRIEHGKLQLEVLQARVTLPLALGGVPFGNIRRELDLIVDSILLLGLCRIDEVVLNTVDLQDEVLLERPRCDLPREGGVTRLTVGLDLLLRELVAENLCTTDEGNARAVRCLESSDKGERAASPQAFSTLFGRVDEGVCGSAGHGGLGGEALCWGAQEGDKKGVVPQSLRDSGEPDGLDVLGKCRAGVVFYRDWDEC